MHLHSKKKVTKKRGRPPKLAVDPDSVECAPTTRRRKMVRQSVKESATGSFNCLHCNEIFSSEKSFSSHLETHGDCNESSKTITKNTETLSDKKVPDDENTFIEDSSLSASRVEETNAEERSKEDVMVSIVDNHEQQNNTACAETSSC